MVRPLWRADAGSKRQLGTRYSRLTWDGSTTAQYGVAQWWNTSEGHAYGGGTERPDEVSSQKDMAIGIMAGRLGKPYGQLDSEGQVRRVAFIRNRYAGVAVGSWNALDWWVWDSQFVDCGRGVTNTYNASDSGQTKGSGPSMSIALSSSARPWRTWPSPTPAGSRSTTMSRSARAASSKPR